MNKTYNSKFEIVNKQLDESVTVSYSATFLHSPETRWEPEYSELSSTDWEIEYYPRWLNKEDIEGHVAHHATTYLFSKNKNHPIFI